jgi:hypothetical protein
VTFVEFCWAQQTGNNKTTKIKLTHTLEVLLLLRTAVKIIRSHVVHRKRPRVFNKYQQNATFSVCRINNHHRHRSSSERERERERDCYLSNRARHYSQLHVSNVQAHVSRCSSAYLSSSRVRTPPLHATTNVGSMPCGRVDSINQSRSVFKRASPLALLINLTCLIHHRWL